MKKCFYFFVLVSFFANMANATNDTIRYGDTCYMFHYLHNPLRPYQISPGVYAAYNSDVSINSILPKLYIASAPVHVYGVAVTVLLEEGDNDSSLYRAYLYQYRNAQLEVLDSSTAYSAKNWFCYSAVGNNGELYEGYSPCLEFYFSHPHYFCADIDSILVGLERRVIVTGNHPDSVCYNEVRALPWDFADGGLTYYSQSGFRRLGWWGTIFPIIQPERIGCEAEVAEVCGRGEDYAVLEWDMEGDSCQLSVAPYGEPVDSGLVVDLTGRSYTAAGLDSGVYYAARLRTQCHHSCHIHDDTVVWSQWGEPAMFYLGSEEPDTTGVGIRRAEAPVELCVTPNPTDGRLTVRCEAVMTAVELYDMQGRAVLKAKGSGTEAMLDLSALPKGTYVIVAHTAKGKATRTVERR